MYQNMMTLSDARFFYNNPIGSRGHNQKLTNNKNTKIFRSDHALLTFLFNFSKIIIIIIIINLYFLQTRYNFRRGREKTTLKDII